MHLHHMTTSLSYTLNETCITKGTLPLQLYFIFPVLKVLNILEEVFLLSVGHLPSFPFILSNASSFFVHHWTVYRATIHFRVAEQYLRYTSYWIVSAILNTACVYLTNTKSHTNNWGHSHFRPYRWLFIYKVGRAEFSCHERLVLTPNRTGHAAQQKVYPHKHCWGVLCLWGAFGQLPRHKSSPSTLRDKQGPDEKFRGAQTRGKAKLLTWALLALQQTCWDWNSEHFLNYNIK